MTAERLTKDLAKANIEFADWNFGRTRCLYDENCQIKLQTATSYDTQIAGNL